MGSTMAPLPVKLVCELETSGKNGCFFIKFYDSVGFELLYVRVIGIVMNVNGE